MNRPTQGRTTYILVFGLLIYVLSVQRVAWLQQEQTNNDNNVVAHLEQPSPSQQLLQTMIQQQEKRLALLESKLDAYLAYNSDPFLSTQIRSHCTNQTTLEEYCRDIHTSIFNNEKDCHSSHSLCLDHFPPPQNCIVYDFGIREEPDFGVILSNSPFQHCEVFAFDPSPITQKWYQDNQQKLPPNYHLTTEYGAGNQDEVITLREYNWDQVTIYSYPQRVLDATNCTPSGQCRYKKFTPQRKHKLPVRSIESIMREYKHSHIDILKLDIEGSEYRVLESLIASGVCRKVNQLLVEWHHYDNDIRYGASSSPTLNVFHKLLEEQCGLKQFRLHSPQGWPSNFKLYAEMGLILRYNLASFQREQ
jgi:FkbM family methyltransferase